MDTHYATDTTSYIQQSLNTIVGQLYEVSFAYSPRINQPEATNGISAYSNGSLLDTVTGTGGAVHNWVVYSFIVVGTGLDTIKFAATGIDDSLGGSLDDIRVSVVPLPAAAFLFAPALLGFLGLRRKAQSV